MAFSISFQDYDERSVGLTKQEVRDLVELFYRGDCPVTINGAMKAGSKKRFLGLCSYNDLFKTINIYLCPKQIRADFGSGSKPGGIGGGTKKIRDFRCNVASILAHEVQHANQYSVHNPNSTVFFGTSRSDYMSRACERDARMFADDMSETIHRVLQVALPPKEEEREMAPLEPIALDLAAMDEEPTIDDLREELRSVGMNNPVAMSKLREMIRILRDPNTDPEVWASATGSL